MTPSMNADQIIAHLDLAPHPEGGHYRQTWVATNPGRPSGTCIYFLLRTGERSHWHRVDATEIWLYHAGAPQIIVPENHWQAARSTGEFTLVSCTVSPGFTFDGFTLAPPEINIPR